MNLPLKWVVLFLGISLLLCVVGVILLSLRDASVPGILENLSIGILGALAGVLVNSKEKANGSV